MATQTAAQKRAEAQRRAKARAEEEDVEPEEEVEAEEEAEDVEAPEYGDETTAFKAHRDFGPCFFAGTPVELRTGESYNLPTAIVQWLEHEGYFDDGS